MDAERLGEVCGRPAWRVHAFALVAAVVMWVFFTMLPHAQAVGVGAVVILFLTFKGVMGVWEAKIDARLVKEKRAIRGAVAEEKMGEILDQLGDEYLIIHDVRCQFGNIDHILLSRDYGVFLIERKAPGGRVAIVDSQIRVNGKLTEEDFVAPTLRHTHWLAEELQTITGVSACVNPLIVFTNASVLENRPIAGITVTNMKFLLQSIRQLGKPLPPEVWAASEKIAGRLN
jgi:hypothetical protein